MGTFNIFEKMSKDNNDELKLSPLSNMKSAKSGKNGWGSVEIAVPNDMVQHLLTDTNYYVGGLLLAKREEFEKYKTE